ncbi:hypothetical protein Dimus_000432 [Dionaea muscipula]
MDRRRPAAVRPSGTDGSDFSYRMIVDSRYTRVANGKSLLARLLLIQTCAVTAAALFMLSPILKGDAASVNELSLVPICFLSLLIGESGRRQSRTGFLKLYMILSSISMLLLVACTIKKDLIQQLFQGQIGSVSDRPKEQLMHAVVVFSGVFLQIFILGTSASLIQNMSPPKTKRSS